VRDGRLLVTYKDGQADLNAYLDDYAFLADALLEMLQTRWNGADCAWLRDLLDQMIARFMDADSGGFFFTSVDHESLMHRSKSFSDDATPSGNGIAARVLVRAGYLLGESRYLEAAERTLQAAWRAIEKFPRAHLSLVAALEEYLSPPDIVVLRGERASLEQWQSELEQLYDPHRMIVAIPADAQNLEFALKDKAARASTVAYLCRGFTCSPPIESLAELMKTSKLRLETPL
jgi:uncharacterized protein